MKPQVFAASLSLVCTLFAQQDAPSVVTYHDKAGKLLVSPDHSRVYIADSGKKQRVGVFEVQRDGTLSKPLFWLTGGADGMRCDVRGNLFTTTRDGVRIYSEAGKHLATVKLPEQPANCAFGGAHGNELFVTARTSLYRMRLRVSGAAIPPRKPVPTHPKALESKGAGHERIRCN